jgi:hypothetical protein
MPELTIEELRKIAREKFGRDLTDAEAQSLALALARLAPMADQLLWWQSQLACFIRRSLGCDSKDGDEAVGFA